MMNNKRNIIVTIIVVIILGVGLTFTINPNLNLKDSILKLVELPENVFHYVKGDRDKNSDDQDEKKDSQGGDSDASGDSSRVTDRGVETPLVLFDDEDTATDANGAVAGENETTTGGEGTAGENPSAGGSSGGHTSGGKNILPKDVLE